MIQMTKKRLTMSSRGEMVTLCLVVVIWLGTVGPVASYPRPVFTGRENNNITQGESGVVCTGINRQCLAGLDCVDKECQCPPGEKGNAEIECVDDDKKLCEVSADPHLHGFDKARANVDIPCRYRLTRYVTTHRAAETPYAHCAVEVFATNELNLGQYYVSSVHISLGVTDNGQQVHEQFEVHKFGVNEDQVYSFSTSTNKTRTVWGSSEHEVIKGVDVYPVFDEVNNFAVLEVPECDTRIKYRAYDRSKHRQEQLPGVTVMAPVDSKFVEGYGFYPHSLCGVDGDGKKLYVNRATELEVDSPNLAIIYDVLNESASQKGTPNEEDCDNAIDIFRLSSNKAADLNFCGTILTNAPTRRCIVEEGFLPFSTFIDCFSFRVFNNLTQCIQVQTIAIACGSNWHGPDMPC